jgi:hypothetical protein
MRRNGSFDLARINQKSIFEVPRETPDSRAEILCSRNDGFIGRMFDQDFVVRLDERGHRQVVRHGSALRMDNAFGGHARLCGQPLDQGVETV